MSKLNPFRKKMLMSSEIKDLVKEVVKEVIKAVVKDLVKNIVKNLVSKYHPHNDASFFSAVSNTKVRTWSCHFLCDHTRD